MHRADVSVQDGFTICKSSELAFCGIKLRIKSVPFTRPKFWLSNTCACIICEVYPDCDLRACFTMQCLPRTQNASVYLNWNVKAAFCRPWTLLNNALLEGSPLDIRMSEFCALPCLIVHKYYRMCLCNRMTWTWHSLMLQISVKAFDL